MAFIRKLTAFSFINICIMLATFLLFIDSSASDMQMTISFIIYCAVIIIFTIISANYYWKKNSSNIWHMPIAQIILCLIASLFFYIRDVLGYRQSSGFLDFGVGLEIILVVILTLSWLIPSFIIAVLYWWTRKHRQ